MSTTNIEEAIMKFEIFVNDVLREDLKQAETRLAEINNELFELTQQKQALKLITDNKCHPGGFKSQVNIGCDFFLEACVEDVSKLLMHVGLNHHLELSLEEANKYLDLRIKAYERKSEIVHEKCLHIKARIKMILIGVAKMHSEKLGYTTSTFKGISTFK